MVAADHDVGARYSTAFSGFFAQGRWKNLPERFPSYQNLSPMLRDLGSRERFKRGSLPLPERLIDDTAYDSNALNAWPSYASKCSRPTMVIAQHHPSIAKTCAAIATLETRRA
jgi:hypothetical protein